MGKVMILTFSEDEEDVCQRMLQIIPYTMAGWP
jgi:hypothetical protein